MRVLAVGICTKKIVVSYMNLSVLFLSVGSRKKLFYFFCGFILLSFMMFIRCFITPDLL